MTVWAVGIDDLDQSRRVIIWWSPTRRDVCISHLLRDQRVIEGSRSWRCTQKGRDAFVADWWQVWHILLNSFVFGNTDLGGVAVPRSRSREAADLQKEGKAIHREDWKPAAPILKQYVNTIQSRADPKLRFFGDTVFERQCIHERVSLVLALTILRQGGAFYSIPPAFRTDELALPEFALSNISQRLNLTVDKFGSHVDPLPPRELLNEFGTSNSADDPGPDSGKTPVIRGVPLERAQIPELLNGMTDRDAWNILDVKEARGEMLAALGDPLSGEYRHCEYWHIEREGHPVAFVGLTVWPTLSGDELWIGFINAVDSVRCGNLRYGNFALGLALHRARARGYQEIRIWTTFGNPSAIRTYRLCGFAPTDRVPPDFKRKKLPPEDSPEYPASLSQDLSAGAVAWPLAHG